MSNLSFVSFAFKAVHTDPPPYLSRPPVPYHPFCVLRSPFSATFLQVPGTNIIFGSRSFRAAAPTNSLRLDAFM